MVLKTYTVRRTPKQNVLTSLRTAIKLKKKWKKLLSYTFNDPHLLREVGEWGEITFP
jgi:hypothetical protein